MISAEYRRIIRGMTINVLRTKAPGLKRKVIDEIAAEIAINVHARMYGANVDGVDSPIWSVDQHGTDRVNDPRTKPNVEAKDLLNG